MTKLHELLAVEKGLDATVDKVMGEALHVFKKGDHFQGNSSITEYFKTEEQHLNNSDAKALDTTVGDKLDYLASHLRKSIDLELQMAATNQAARADLVVEGVTVAKDVPGLFLLGMESRLKAIRAVYAEIPTHQPGVTWEPDLSMDSKGRVYKSKQEKVTERTRQELQTRVVVAPTEHHPAQYEKWTAQIPVAKTRQTVWTGTISPAEKSDILERLDTLLRAVRQARQRANNTEVVNSSKIAKQLLEYINSGAELKPA